MGDILMSKTNFCIRSMLAFLFCLLVWTTQPSFGQMTFEMAYPTPTEMYGVDQTFDSGNITIGQAGGTPVLVKTDMGGFAQWSIVGGFTNPEGALDVQEAANTDIIWTTGISTGQSFVSRSNNVGALQWNQSFQVLQTTPLLPWSTHPTSIIEQQYSYVGDIVFGGITQGPGGHRYVYIHKVNSAGTTVWYKMLYFGDLQEFTCVREALDGNIIVVCQNEFQQMMVWKLDGSNGNYLWGQMYNDPVFPRDAVVHPNTGEIVVTGNYPSGGKYNVFAMAFDNGGTPLWQTGYNASGVNFYSNDIANPLLGGSNTYLITGESEFPNGWAGTAAFFLQIASNGTPQATNITLSTGPNNNGVAQAMTPSVTNTPGILSGYVAVGNVNLATGYLLRVTEDGRNNCTVPMPVSPTVLGGGFTTLFWGFHIFEAPNLFLNPVGPQLESVQLATDLNVCAHMFLKQGAQQPIADVNNNAATLRITPNPVLQGQAFSMRISHTAQKPVTILVTNTLGQTVFKNHLHPTTAESTIQIPTNSWSAGMYNVTVLRDNQPLETASVVVYR